MNTKLTCGLVIASLCGLSVVTDAHADVQTRSFVASLTNNTVVAGGLPYSTSTGNGTAEFLLTWDPANPSGATIDYDIHVAADLDGQQTAALHDDVTAIHLHDITMCMSAACQMGDTSGTMHVLGIFGSPRADDAEMQFFPTTGRVTGRWDVSDEDMMLPVPAMAPGGSLDELFNGQLYLMVHTREFPTGAFGGYLVPEPTSVMGLAWGVLGLALGLRRRNRSATH